MRERNGARKKLGLFLVLVTVLMLMVSCGATSDLPKEPEGFSFSLTWGCYGISSYDSNTGKLVKTTDATHPADYVTTYYLSAEEYQQIYDLIRGLNMKSYPNRYNPHGNLQSSPSMTLILSVSTNTWKKTITAEDIAYSYESDNKKGQAFLSVCEEIRNLLVDTEAWKALPEYEFFYD